MKMQKLKICISNKAMSSYLQLIMYNTKVARNKNKINETLHEK